MGRDPAGVAPFFFAHGEASVDQPKLKTHHVTEHLANERTVLAWVRTSIAHLRHVGRAQDEVREQRRRDRRRVKGAAGNDGVHGDPPWTRSL
ncbi:MAG: DUF202 domain-containing protein, partial [Reyranella sp.]